MADWRTNEKFRKPRRAKGTPLYTQRNYFALGVLAFGGVSWYLLELWPQSQRLKKNFLDGKYDLPEGFDTKVLHIRKAFESPELEGVLAKARDKEFEKNAPQLEDPWFLKLFKSKPDL